LKNMHALALPEDLDHVAFQCEQLQSLVGVSADSIFTLSTDSAVDGVLPIYYPDVYKLGPANTGISLWWTTFYGHDSVQTILFQAWEYSWLEGSFPPTQEQVHVTRELLEQCGFDVNLGSPGQILVELAISNANVSVLKLLLAIRDLNVNVQNPVGHTALYQALIAENTEIVNHLLTSGRYYNYGQLHWSLEFWTRLRFMSADMRAIITRFVTGIVPVTSTFQEDSTDDNESQSEYRDFAISKGESLSATPQSMARRRGEMRPILKVSIPDNGHARTRDSSSAVVRASSPEDVRPRTLDRQFVFVTPDGWNYRLIDISMIESAEDMRTVVLHNLGVPSDVNCTLHVPVLLITTVPSMTTYSYVPKDARLTA
jgi:hypothetical protein